MAEKRDFGLAAHRITQYVITGLGAAMVYIAQGTYEEVRSTAKDVSAMRESISSHGTAINDLRMDLREVQKEVHSISSTTLKTRRP